MLIGQATLKSAAFCPRLTMLLDDLRAADCTVWLEGMSLRFDCAEDARAWARPAELSALMTRYSDVVTWLPEPRAELAGVPAVKASDHQNPPAPRWHPFLRGRRHSVKPGVKP